MKWLQKKALIRIVSLFMICTIQLHGDEDTPQPYLSPGVQLGYGFGEGLFFSSQLTLGWVTVEDEGWTISPLNPGVSIGVRKYFGNKKPLITYADIQSSAVVAGVGIGVCAMRSRDGNDWIFGKRVKLWSGALGLLTYDYLSIPNVQQSHNWGAMGVLPLIQESE